MIAIPEFFNPRRTLACCLFALLFAGCAGTPERAEQVGGSPSAESIGEASEVADLLPAAALTSIAAEDVHSAMTKRGDVLRQLLNTETARGDLSTPALHDDRLIASWRGDALFTKDTAQLRPRTLAGLSRIAKWLRADGATVLQIVGEQNGADPDQMAERRAAAIEAFLIAEGTLAPRVRTQLVDISQLHPARRSSASTSDGNIVLLVVPVVAGRESLAWIPPAVD